jgi:tRNA modification GTPase
MPAAVSPAPSDTIVARATAAGRGGVAIVRVSGPQARHVALGLLGEVPAPRHATLAGFRDAQGEALDLGLALFFPAPHSFTGEDVLELHAHGGTVVTELLIERVLGLGARLARPGEFTERAFLNDKLDLAQAEAIADLIDADSRAAARAAQRSLRGDFSAAVLALNEQVTALRTWVEAAIDFPDEDIDFLGSDELRARLAALDVAFAEVETTVRLGCRLREGLHVVIAGRPNAGKSSLLNALAGHDAAIVTPLPGTTRDLVQERIEIDGLPVHVVDTAGLRVAGDIVEEEGVRRARAALARADHALVVVDASTAAPGDAAALAAELPAGLERTVVRNKIDLTAEAPGYAGAARDIVNVSALTRAGLDALRGRLRDVAGFHPAGEGLMTARRRHLESLQAARAHFEAARTALAERQAGELMAEELLQAQNALAEITGAFTSEDLLARIFQSFCIGK